ncbi:MAG: Stf0 family sulfotransferase [Caulobacteraceae bacterium]
MADPTGQTDARAPVAASARESRLRAFPDTKVAKIHEQLRNVDGAPWPDLPGCLLVLFTARSGSTYLCRELEKHFHVGKMAETLNPAQISKTPVELLLSKRLSPWFAFKAGFKGVVGAECSGFVDTYLNDIVLVRLIRRDIVAQAVSLVKATQTRQWHLTDAIRQPAHYDLAEIESAIIKIASVADRLRTYAESMGRPCEMLAYEDFSGGDTSAALRICDRLGVPRRSIDSPIEHRPTERMGDEMNEQWRQQASREMGAVARDWVSRYRAAVEAP